MTRNEISEDECRAMSLSVAAELDLLKRDGVGVSPETIRRWIVAGIGGIHLEGFLIGARYTVTLKGVRTFLRKLNRNGAIGEMASSVAEIPTQNIGANAGELMA